MHGTTAFGAKVARTQRDPVENRWGPSQSREPPRWLALRSALHHETKGRRRARLAATKFPSPLYMSVWAGAEFRWRQCSAHRGARLPSPSSCSGGPAAAAHLQASRQSRRPARFAAQPCSAASLAPKLPTLSRHLCELQIRSHPHNRHLYVIKHQSAL